MAELLVGLITTPPKDAERIARTLVEERLAACVNIICTVKSYYWWKDEVQVDEECLLIVKTTRKVADRLINRVKEVHPYTVPEVVLLPAERVLEEYLEWAVRETSDSR